MSRRYQDGCLYREKRKAGPDAKTEDFVGGELKLARVPHGCRMKFDAWSRIVSSNGHAFLPPLPGPASTNA
jgi:hypothetical protein